ncbi:MAG: hypothetical protein IJH76_03955 [Clostridia bacterium]|nr:hypothetical protein [Clostridia bacterium]
MSIQSLYESVVEGNRYDLIEATQHNKEMYLADVKARDLPLIEANYISHFHVGCCLHYGMALFYKMRMHNIPCYIAITKEENPETHKKTDNHVSVCYIKKGIRYIADPVETVKTWLGDFYDIPIARYLKEYKKIKLYDPYGEYGDELFFKDFLSHPIETIKLR